MSNAADERKRRLAQALRENLKRRKAQDRARRDGVGPEESAPGEAAPEAPATTAGREPETRS